MKPNSTSKPFPRLTDLEREVAAESREWGRQRLQARLQPLADELGEVFPLRQRRLPAPTRCAANWAKSNWSLPADYTPVRAAWAVPGAMATGAARADHARLGSRRPPPALTRKRRRSPANGRKPWMTPPGLRSGNGWAPGRKTRHCDAAKSPSWHACPNVARARWAS
jgi:hypothetical protein